ncbi:MAG: hypothetical protein ACYS8I_05595 [Planctomycetota bacterium]|jgi:hypothetical protein
MVVKMKKIFPIVLAVYFVVLPGLAGAKEKSVFVEISGTLANSIGMKFVRIIYDEGKSWQVAKQVFSGPTAYSCLAQLPNGDIGLLYERGDRHRYEKMTFTRFTLDWLTDGKDKGEVRWRRKK